MTADYYDIQVAAEGHVDARTFVFDLADEETFNIIIEMAEAGGIAGQILDGNGDPITTATVTAQGQTTIKSVTVDGAGNYDIGSLPAGGYMVEAVAQGYTPGLLAGVTVVAGDTSADQDLILTGGTSRLVVTVLDCGYRPGDHGVPLWPVMPPGSKPVR